MMYMLDSEIYKPFGSLVKKEDFREKYLGYNDVKGITNAG